MGRAVSLHAGRIVIVMIRTIGCYWMLSLLYDETPIYILYPSPPPRVCIAFTGIRRVVVGTVGVLFVRIDVACYC